MLCAPCSHVFNMEFLEMGTRSPEKSLGAVWGGPRVSLAQLREACARERSKKKIQRQAQKTRRTLNSSLWGACNHTCPHAPHPPFHQSRGLQAVLIFQAKHEGHRDQSPPSRLGRAEDQICPKFSPPRWLWPFLFPKGFCSAAHSPHCVL